MLPHFLAVLAVLPFTSAHFTLDWPQSRGFDDAKATGGPCGGFDSVNNGRTEFPLSDGPVQLNMHHTQTKIAVYLALGNDPTGDDFTITLVPTVAEEGPGGFCFGSVNIPSDLNITAGTNGTIQVVTNGDPTGGLYQCGDVTFVNTTLSQSDHSDHCKNGTNVKVTQENVPGQPNGTSTASENPSASGSGDASSPSETGATGAATHASAGAWVLGAVGVAAFAML